MPSLVTRVCVYSKYFLKWFMSSTFDNCVHWYWPTLGWGTLHGVICREMYCFIGRKNRYSLCLILGTELQYTSLHKQYYTTVTCVWKLSGINFKWLVYCLGLNFGKWSPQLYTLAKLVKVLMQNERDFMEATYIQHGVN